MTTTQLNIRVPYIIKERAQKKAEDLGTNVNFLVKLFLSSFIQNDCVEITQKVDLEKVFDTWFIKHFMSNQGKKQAKNINTAIENLLENEEKYLT